MTIEAWFSEHAKEQAPALSRDLGLTFVIRRVMPSANKWMRKIWMAEEWPKQCIGFNRRVFEDEVGSAVKKIQCTALTRGCYLEGAEAEIMGFATGEYVDDNLVIYFAYTKEPYRKCGVFMALLDAFGYEREKGFVTSSWLFSAGKHGGRKHKLQAHFNPYILFRRAYEHQEGRENQKHHPLHGGAGSQPIHD